MAHNILKGFFFFFFWFACADIQFLKKWSEKALNLAQNDNFSILSLFYRPFCYHSNGKSKINARILHLDHSSIKPIRWNWWKVTFSFLLQRGPILPLNARPPFVISHLLPQFVVCFNALSKWLINSYWHSKLQYSKSNDVDIMITYTLRDWALFYSWLTIICLYT